MSNIVWRFNHHHASVIFADDGTKKKTLHLENVGINRMLICHQCGKAVFTLPAASCTLDCIDRHLEIHFQEC